MCIDLVKYNIDIIKMDILTILICLIILAYITIYTKPKNNIEIIQTNSHANFDLSLLNEKQPIVIYDDIKNSKEFINQIMSYQYNFKIIKVLHKNTLYQNNSKFAIIYNDKQIDLNISISKVTKKYNHLNLFYSNIDMYSNEVDFNIIVKPGNILIIPYLYLLKSHDQNTNVDFFNDILHIISY